MRTWPKEIGWLERVENLFLRFGVRSLSMDEIASELGISKKTLYQWVPSKDELVKKVLESFTEKIKSRSLERAEEAPNAIDEIFMLLETSGSEISQVKSNVVNDLQKYHHEAWELMRQFQYDFTCKTIERNLERGRAEGLYREDFDISIVARIHLASAFNLFDQNLFPVDTFAPDRLFQEHLLYYLHGIASSKGRQYLKKKLS